LLGQELILLGRWLIVVGPRCQLPWEAKGWAVELFQAFVSWA